MFRNFQKIDFNSNSHNSNSQHIVFHSSSLIKQNLRSLRRSSYGSRLSQQIFLGVAILFSTSFSAHALTSKTSNPIEGSAPYLTFDGGHTRAVDTDGLLGITLSNGVQYTPSTNTSSTTPIELPVIGQSFADINMLMPTDTNEVELSALIGSPYYYWGDDDGDDDITATGSLSLSIVDKYDQAVSRNTVPEICKAPYQVKLTNTDSTLATRYGIPQGSTFSANDVTYYVNPKTGPVVCFAKPSLKYGVSAYAGPATMWDPNNGFLPQSSYDLNFPTVGGNNLYFDLAISGNNQVLSWSPVSHGGITATMTNSTSTGVRVTLTGPVASQSQWGLNNPGPVAKPTLPQTFELVGRDSNGNAVVKYGFVLKQWFVGRGNGFYVHPNTVAWCNNIGYRIPKVKDLTNASCQRHNAAVSCEGSVGATPPSPSNVYQRHIGAGFFTEWGTMRSYPETDFTPHWYWTGDSIGITYHFIVFGDEGTIDWGVYDEEKEDYNKSKGLCVWP